MKELPPHLKDSNVLQMTVAQSKGLEFDDVFLWDFFNGSKAEWRPLNNYVAHLEEVQSAHGHKKLPAGTPWLRSPTACLTPCTLSLHDLYIQASSSRALYLCCATNRSQCSLTYRHMLRA